VTVKVLDQGAGFESDFLPVAFERFTRADSARSRDRGGSGLGLAIAGELVKALEGRIWAEPGPGGRVNIELPVGV
jgi:signal transduction histidine kinase